MKKVLLSIVLMIALIVVSGCTDSSSKYTHTLVEDEEICVYYRDTYVQKELLFNIYTDLYIEPETGFLPMYEYCVSLYDEYFVISVIYKSAGYYAKIRGDNVNENSVVSETKVHYYLLNDFGFYIDKK